MQVTGKRRGELVLTGTLSKSFADWIGRSSESEDLVTARLVDSFRAIFDPHLAPVADGAAPLGIHWCLAPAVATMGELGADGHPSLNLTLPPVPLPRRMWAGGSVETLGPLWVGDKVRRVSRIADVIRKDGRAGELWFVAIDHDYVTDRGPAIRERQDLVYREAAKPGNRASPDGSPTSAAVRPAARSWTVETPSTLLFRYSAITFNAHRIHYDFPYATEAEGYAGLVVHGPLQATLLFNLAATAGGGAPKTFRYRGVSPATAGNWLAISQGTGDERGKFWTQGPDGIVHMEATVE